MALVEIQTYNDIPYYEQAVILDGVIYAIDLYFNQRINDGVGKWMITLSDPNRKMICGPVPVIVSTPLFDRFVEFAIPPGTIFAFDTSGKDIDPGQFDLGDRVRLYYLEVAS